MRAIDAEPTSTSIEAHQVLPQVKPRIDTLLHWRTIRTALNANLATARDAKPRILASSATPPATPRRIQGPRLHFSIKRGHTNAQSIPAGRRVPS